MAAICPGGDELIEAQTVWLSPFSSRHFPMYFHEWKCIHFNWDFTEFCSYCKGPSKNFPALVQIMAWCWSGNKPLSEPMWLVWVSWCIYASLSLNELSNFQANFSDWWLRYLLWNCCAAEKLSWFIRYMRYLSDGLYILYWNFFNFSSDIWA